MKNREEF